MFMSSETSSAAPDATPAAQTIAPDTQAVAADADVSRDPGGQVELRGLQETARLFGISAPTLREWIIEGCPVYEQGSNGVAYKLNIYDVRAWKAARDGERAEADAAQAVRDAQFAFELLGDDQLPDPTGAVGGRLSSKQRAELMRAEKDKIEIATRRRELVRAADVAGDLTRAFALLSARLLSMPDRLGTEFGLDDEAVEKLRERMGDALNDAADEIGDLPDDPADAPQVQTVDPDGGGLV